MGTPTPRVKPENRKRRGAVANKPFVPTPKQRAIVRGLASIGYKHEDICIAITNPETGKPIDDKTLRLHFREELTGAKEEANAAVAAALFNNATKSNNVAAQIFWLKTQAGLREHPQQVELSGRDGKPIEQKTTTGVLVVPGIAQDLDKWSAYVAKTMDENQKKADEILRDIKASHGKAE